MEKIVAFEDDFSTQKADWINTAGWTFDTVNKQLAPTLTGTISSNYIQLNRAYGTDVRRFTTDVLLYADTVMNVFGRNGIGQSMYEIDVPNRKLKMYTFPQSGGMPGTIAAETDITIPIVDGQRYVIEMSKKDFNFYLSITNYNTLESNSLTLIGWAGGRQNQNYAYALKSGTPFRILGNKLFLPTNIDGLGVGDSIFEGDRVYGNQTEFSGKVATLIGKTTKTFAISAISGASASSMMRFENEYNFIKPKTIILLAGTNGGMSAAVANEFITKSLAINARPIVNYIPIMSNNNTNTTVAGLPKQYQGARFDIATAIGNVVANGKNNSLFVDGIHPNRAGGKVLADRFFFDVPNF